MPGITEVAILPIKAGVSLDPNEDTGTIFQEALATLLDQPGVQRTYWGTEIENPATLRLFVDWDSVDAHKTFQKAPQYQPFLKALGSFMDGAPSVYHTEMRPHPPTAPFGANVPTTEIATFHFSPSATEQNHKDVHEGLLKLLSAVESAAEAGTYHGSACGFSVESDVSRSGSDEKSKVFVGLIGWSSIEAHHAFRETQAFKDNVHRLRDAKGIAAMNVVHINATENQARGFGAEERGAIDNRGSGAGNVQEEVLNPQRGEKVAPKAHSDGTTTKNSEQSQYKDIKHN